MAPVTDDTETDNGVTEDYDRGNLGLGIAFGCGLLAVALSAVVAGCLWIKLILEAMK